MDELSCQLAQEEPLPENPLPLPNLAPHLSDKIMMSGQQKHFRSTLDRSLQERVNELAGIRQEMLRANQIHNMACLVMDVESGEVLAYMGNTKNEKTQEHGSDVDIITSQRSTGSILKPFLFAGMIDNGNLLQSSLIPDVPIRYNGYAPKNYDREYEGAVPAARVLSRSLNIPSVILLRRYGVDPFLNLLKQLGFSSFRESHEHYGLTLILGGGESSLWELAGVYGSMARVLNRYNAGDGNYSPDDYHMPRLENKSNSTDREIVHDEGLISAGSIYITFQSLLDVNRPEELSLWYLMSSTRNIAWKTGTSYGFRDAWALGVTPEYLVAVWAGNADGEGRPGLSGVTSAAPLMFDIFSLLPETSWFEAPLDDLSEAVICKQSGFIAGPNCDEKDTIMVVSQGQRSEVCPYHILVHTDQSRRFRVNSRCYPVTDMNTEAWFVLPPLMEWYYKRNNASYRRLPPVMEGCSDQSVALMEIVYPEWDSHVVIPTELDGKEGKVVLEVAHRDPHSRLFWHLDEDFIGETRGLHHLAVHMLAGDHILHVVDEAGNREDVRFEVLDRSKANEE